MSYDRLSTTITQLIIVLFCFPHSKSRRVQKSTFCMHCILRQSPYNMMLSPNQRVAKLPSPFFSLHNK